MCHHNRRVNERINLLRVSIVVHGMNDQIALTADNTIGPTSQRVHGDIKRSLNHVH